MVILFSIIILVVIIGSIVMLASRGDINDDVDVETNKKIFKFSGIAVLSSIILCIILIFISSLNSSPGNRCDICREPATHTFQGYGYCDEHYQDAIKWAFEHTKEN